MSILARRCVLRYNFVQFTKEHRFSSIAAEAHPVIAEDIKPEKRPSRRRQNQVFPGGYEVRFKYPEFLPDPKIEWRNLLREKLERADMMSRRTQIDLPEFYVGSILSVTYADPHNQGKLNRFVGICIERGGCGLRAYFGLRNVVDHQGVEIQFDLYDPTLAKVQVLRLEKRLDNVLQYLRDAPAEYSTFDFDMEPEILLEGAPVPINPLVVPLKPRPWQQRWERHDLKGVENLDKHITPKMMKQRDDHKKPYLKYDLMKTYRATIPEEEQNEVWNDVYTRLHQMEISSRKTSRKRSIVLPKKMG